MAEALINIPETARAGEIVEIKILISHPMETGFRPLRNGGFAPRDIVTSLRCLVDGEVVHDITLFPAIAANPFFVLPLRAEASGEIVLEWTDWNGTVHRQSGQIAVA